ncbi:DUF4405 domain-containing protein [uncultured Fibrobacter sp.]|uniref:DUF4405 domain-containing protein n=1 Tax=uncultured Fibrobacter sp. TaxID=261512 RepID=UPI0028042CA3|nr:DUF4405 domain-containing protein [uncultured Fibrobacter sp.]
MGIKKKIKIFIDVLMFADFLFLMSHEFTRDLYAHGCLGIALFFLFLVHHFLNPGFFRSLPKGHFNRQRILLCTTDLLLLLLMLLMAFSSVMMSGSIFEFSSIQMTSWSRPLHTFSCSWGFLVIGFHLGIHLNGISNKLPAIPFGILTVLLISLGIFCAVHSEFYVYLFQMNMWKMSATSLFQCLGELLGMTAGMIALASLTGFSKAKFPQKSKLSSQE